MLRIAIVEDEDRPAQELREYLERYAAERGEQLDVTRFADGEDIAIGYKANFDIILLDIQLPFMDGMTAAQFIREKDTEVVIIFITNMAQYAIRGYEVDALDYVVKPVSYFTLSQRLDRAIARMKGRRTSYIGVSVEGGVQKLATSSIYYVESQGHSLLYHTADGIVASTGTLQAAEDSLEPHHFHRCNKGFLVNLEHVDGVRDGFAMVKGTRVPISRPRKNEFLEELINYIGGVVK